MDAPSIYINLDDDVNKIATRIKKERSEQVVLVCPKRCFLFNDSINLRLLKKQTDLLGKSVSILTMDEKGQVYAKDAGFSLKYFPKMGKSTSFSDIRQQPRVLAPPVKVEPVVEYAEVGPEPEEEEEAAEEVIQETRRPQVAAPQILVSSKIHNNKFLEEEYRPQVTEEYLEEEPEKPRGGSGKWVVMFLLVSALVAAAVFFVLLPKAEVVIYPKIETVTRDMEVNASVSAGEPDASKLVLPATKVEEALELKQTFESQGKREVGNKATGTIKIYNFSNLPLNLKSSTTFLTVAGKKYLLTSDVNALRPTTYKNAQTKEVDESSLGASFEVVAEQGGEGYNIPAGTRMEISNQVLGSKPQVIYARNDTAIVGGTSRYLSLVSEVDIANSQKVLSDSLLSSLRKKLEDQKLVLADKSFNIEVVEFKTNKPANTESPNFEANLKIKVTGLAINKDQMNKLIYDRVSSTVSSSKDLEMPKADDIVFAAKEMSPDLQSATYSVHFEGKAIYKASIDNLQNQLKGKSTAQVNDIIKSDFEVERVDITLAPAWQAKMPWFASKIKVSKHVE